MSDQYSNVKIYNTICDAVQKRQTEAIHLAKDHDIVFILGSKNSSNTTKLYKICKSIQPTTYLLESANYLNPLCLKSKKKICITGGASTPEELILELSERIKLLTS